MTEHLKRGNLLWEGSRMFLPEHKEALLKLQQKEHHQPKPDLDEQAFHQMGLYIVTALNYTLPVRIYYWEQHQIKEIEGLVTKVDELNQHIVIESGQMKTTLRFDTLTEVQFL